MAVPKRRISTTRKRKRRTHFKLDLPNLIVCPSCKKPNKSHIVCKECEHYDGKKVL